MMERAWSIFAYISSRLVSAKVHSLCFMISEIGQFSFWQKSRSSFAVLKSIFVFSLHRYKHNILYIRVFVNP